MSGGHGPALSLWLCLVLAPPDHAVSPTCHTVPASDALLCSLSLFPEHYFLVSYSLISRRSPSQCYPLREYLSTVLLHDHSLSLTWFNFSFFLSFLNKFYRGIFGNSVFVCMFVCVVCVLLTTYFSLNEINHLSMGFLFRTICSSRFLLES